MGEISGTEIVQKAAKTHMRFTRDGNPFTSDASCFACTKESLTSLSITYLSEAERMRLDRQHSEREQNLRTQK